jgi:hypothetical protein
MTSTCTNSSSGMTSENTFEGHSDESDTEEVCDNVKTCIEDS